MKRSNEKGKEAVLLVRQLPEPEAETKEEGD